MNFLSFFLIRNVQCSICGAFTGFVKKSYCAVCLQLLVFELKIRARKVDGISHIYAISWLPGQSDLISHFLMALKANPSEELYLNLSRLWLGQLNKKKGLGPTILVPIPSHRRPGQALKLAQSISNISGFMIWDGLLLVDSEEQKRKGRKSRQERRIDVRKNFTSKDLKSQRIVLIDDVLTTGATVRAALRALEGVQIEEIWTIAYREEKPFRLKLKD